MDKTGSAANGGLLSLGGPVDRRYAAERGLRRSERLECSA
jgi:hypothetical protein